MNGSALRKMFLLLWAASASTGCGGRNGEAGSAAGTPGPSLDAASPEERAAAAREAAKKFGTKP